MCTARQRSSGKVMFSVMSVMAHSHCTGQGQGLGPENVRFLFNAIYCAHYTGTGTGTETGQHCFLFFILRGQ